MKSKRNVSLSGGESSHLTFRGILSPIENINTTFTNTSLFTISISFLSLALRQKRQRVLALFLSRPLAKPHYSGNMAPLHTGLPVGGAKINCSFTR
jgi:hypothetical protein